MIAFNRYVIAIMVMYLHVALNFVASGQQLNQTEQLRLSGLEPSEAAMIAAEGAIGLEHELILRMAWRARKTPGTLMDRAIAGRINNGTDAIDFAASQFLAVRVSGSLLQLEKWGALDPDAQPSFWKLRVKLVGGQEMLAVVSELPAAWTKAVLPVKEIRLTGLVVAPVRSGGESVEPVWMVAAKRAEWFPEKPDQELKITPGIVTLATRGFDVGLADEIRRAGTRPLIAAERPAFDSFRKAVSSVRVQDWNDVMESREVATISDLLAHPERIIALPVTLRGTVRRVTDIGTGVQQVELLVETGRKSIAITNSEGERLEFGSRLPLTVNMEANGGELVGLERQLVTVDGFAYRFWTYESGFSVGQGAESGQTVPLVIGWRIVAVETGRATIDAVLGWAAAGLIGSVALIVAAVWWMNRRDRKQKAALWQESPKIELPH